MIYRRKKVQRTQFRKLPNGATYYKSDSTGPFVKIANRAILASNSDPMHANGAIGTAVADTSVGVMKVPKAQTRAS